MNKREMKKFQKDSKRFLDKFWFLIWKDDSFKGWIFSIIFLFIFIKLIFFPTLSFVTGTPLPLAIVESCSMYHPGNLLSNPDKWWQVQENKYLRYDLDKENFENFAFKRGFNKGDILFIMGAKPEKIEIGDVIIFNSGKQKTPIIHRVIDIQKDNNNFIFSTLGDNNPSQLPFEKTIQSNQIVGKAVFRLAPYAGWGKLIFFELLKGDKYTSWLCE